MSKKFKLKNVSEGFTRAKIFASQNMSQSLQKVIKIGKSFLRGLSSLTILRRQKIQKLSGGFTRAKIFASQNMSQSLQKVIKIGKSFLRGLSSLTILRRQKIQKLSGGFTLIETLVAITILIITITATFSAVQSGISTSRQSKNEIISFYLAQEAIEFVRNKRDGNILNGDNWLSGFGQPSDPCGGGRFCSVDAINNSLVACPSGNGTCPNVTQYLTNPSSSQYGLYSMDASWTRTIFNRQVQVTAIGADQAQVSVTVSWVEGVSPRSFKATEILANWQ
jgi:type II secretory pathway pseudopilin PulG